MELIVLIVFSLLVSSGVLHLLSRTFYIKFIKHGVLAMYYFAAAGDLNLVLGSHLVNSVVIGNICISNI